MNNPIKSFFLLVLAGCAFSCSPRATVTTSSQYSREDLEIVEIQFEYLSMKSKVIFQEGAGNKKNASASIRVRKDSVIWFNLSGTLGMQGMRGLLTRDSIKMLNRVDKEYWQLDYEQLSKEFNFNIDYDLIQAMILGDMPKGKQETESITQHKGSFIIHQAFGDIYIDNYIDTNTRRVTEVEILEAPSKNSLKLLYGNFQLVEGHYFPFSNFLSLIHNNEFGELETRVNIDHSRVAFADKSLRFPFTVPNKYVKK